MEPKDGHSAIAEHAPLGIRSALALGANVERLRKQAKLTKARLCLMVGIGRPYLNRIEKGEADPRLSVVERLAEALETTPQALITPPEEH